MTGPWLFVKWVGIVVLIGYLALSAVAIWRLRLKKSRLPSNLVWPLIVGNFVAVSLPWIFEDVIFARVCFIVAQVVYLYGLAILIMGWHRRNGGVFSESES